MACGALHKSIHTLWRGESEAGRGREGAGERNDDIYQYKGQKHKKIVVILPSSRQLGLRGQLELFNSPPWRPACSDDGGRHTSMVQTTWWAPCQLTAVSKLRTTPNAAHHQSSTALIKTAFENFTRECVLDTLTACNYQQSATDFDKETHHQPTRQEHSGERCKSVCHWCVARCEADW
jgi:hypothetical protein